MNTTGIEARFHKNNTLLHCSKTGHAVGVARAWTRWHFTNDTRLIGVLSLCPV